MKIRNQYFKLLEWSSGQKIFLIYISFIITIKNVSSAQPAQQGTNKVSHQQSAVVKERSEDSDPVGPSYSVGKYSTKSYAPSPSSNYYAYPNNPYNGYYNPVSDPYYDGYYERPSRQISARSSNYPMIAAASNQIGFGEPEYGGLAAATGHSSHHAHGQSNSHGGGGGWGGWSGGHGHGHYESVSKVDTSSLGLLGLLGLLSLLSNVLNLITTTAAAAAPAPAPAPAARTDKGGRFRRDVVIPKDQVKEDLNDMNLKDRTVWVCEKILPSLNIVGHAQNGLVPVNCTHQGICETNRILVNELGVQGRVVGSVMSKAIVKMLNDVDKTAKPGKYLIKAGLDGRNGLHCETVYPTCETLQKSPGALPQLLSPEHVYKIVHGQHPRNSISNSKIFPSL